MSLLQPLSQRLYLALMHHPIKDRTGSVITGSIFQTDFHDFSRLATTYDLGGVFITHPTESQRELTRRMLRHWTEGHGAKINPHRMTALQKTRLIPNLGPAIEEVTRLHDQQPVILTTTAATMPGQWQLDRVYPIIENATPVIIVFGTGWGLTEEFLLGFDGVLAPIDGFSGYNHLSVRSAASIIVDRVFQCAGSV